ncbi:MAG: CapA family protein [Lachnospiraceae bacterium]|nr:CapA family protein [Lachnospiraceae bacterium]
MKKRLLSLILLLIVICVPASCAAADPTASVESTVEEESVSRAEEFSVTLGFAGDMCFSDPEAVMVHFHQTGDDIRKCIDPTYIKAMSDMDVMWVNNEFCYSDRGTPMAGKAWTFRSATKNVKLLSEMGVDIVGLANNHVYDYGREAFLDTLGTLKKAGIPYVGAGADINEASSPVYIDVGVIRIAYVAATRAEKYILTPEAGKDTPGVFRCYDNTLFIEKIKEARANADFVVVLPHWGTEHTTVLEPVQKTTGREYINAGADIVIGAHSHCLQGMEYYKDKLIAYSLGNFWFDEYNEDTILLKVTLTGTSADNMKAEISVIPGTQKNTVTTCASTTDEKNRIYKYLEKISVNITVTPEGTVLADRGS